MDMNMIPASMATQNSDVSGFTCLTNQITGSQSHLTFQNVVSIFRNPHQMILYVIDCNAALFCISRSWITSHERSYHKLNLTKALRLKAKVLNLVHGKIKMIFLIMAVGGMATLWMAIAADMGVSLAVILNGLRLLGEFPDS